MRDAVKWGRAIASGVIGAFAVIVIFAVARWVLRVNADVTTLIGAVALPGGGAGAWGVGAVVQLILGAVAGVIYGLLFEYATRRAGWLVGGIIGIGHALFAGVAIGFLPMRAGGETAAALPGAFLEYRGLWAIVVLVVAHIVFGVIVGAMYGATRHPASAPGVRWRELRQLRHR